MLTETPPLTPAKRAQPVPMSFGQQGIWLLHQTLPDPAAYHWAWSIRFSRRVEPAKIRRCLGVIQERHEIFRTALGLQAGQLVQLIAPAQSVPVPWQEMDLRARSPDQQPAELRELLATEARRPFDLARAPLWRVVWIELGGQEQVLALTFHHSIMDDWSLRLLIHELEQLYAADGQPGPADLPELSQQYGDFAIWQRQRLAGAAEPARSYWREQLKDLPRALELPTELARRLPPTGQGAIHRFQLPGSVTAKFRELARQEGTTLFTAVLAAFQTWLYRATGQTDILVGTPATTRHRRKEKSLLGYFLNTLPIRTRLDPRSDFQTVLQQVRANLLAAFRHANLPFEQMVELAVKQREPGRQPLYQVMFVLLGKTLPPLRLDSAQGQFEPVDTQTSKNDLTLKIEAEGPDWNCELAYATDVFTADGAARLARQFTELLAAIVENPQAPVCQLRRMPTGFAARPAPEPPLPAPWTGGLAERLREQAERTPGAEAVVLGGNSLTYRQLDQRASQLASRLQGLGVGPEVMVGLCLERSLEQVVALLAVLKAGGTLVPIDPDLPRERIEYILADAQMPWLLTQWSLQGNLAATGARLLVLDQALPPPPAGAPAAADPKVKPENTAYVTYTSGSTGRPKGVLISHAAYLNYCGPAIDFWQLKPADRVLQFARFGFDVGLDQLLTPLLAGATVVLRPEEIWDPAWFTNVVLTHGLTVVHLPPSFWQKWVEAFPPEAVGQAIGNLRLVQVGGEVMPAAAVRRWRELKLPSVRLVNRYGPTETTMFSTAHEVSVRPSAEADADRIPIGRAVGRRTIHLLDEQRQPVPAGSTGEIYIGGETLASGYLNQPELTAEKFIPDPFRETTGARLYKTGDRGRFRPDGSLDFLGRLDHQVKLRGFRVELGEIEAVLGGHPEVTAGAVAANQVGEDKMLVAYLMSREPGKLAVDSLRRWLAKKLPDYMIPARFVTVPALPLNANGKLDRQALAKLDGLELPSGTEFVAPRNPLEQKLAAIWQEVLRVDQVGVFDNFFDLGGHSLLATQVVSRLQQAVGSQVPLKMFFAAPTVAGLAEQIDLILWSATSKDQQADQDSEVI